MFAKSSAVFAFVLAFVMPIASQAQENLALDNYTCAEFLHDTTHPENGSSVLKSMMMISWATGYASGIRQKFARADAKAFVLMASALGAACRKEPTQRAAQVVIKLVQRSSFDEPRSLSGGVETDSSRPKGAAVAIDSAHLKMEQEAKSFVRSMEARWSKPNNIAFVGLSRFFEDKVLYYGKMVSRDKLIEDKRAFATQWPAREYKLERPMSASCHDRVCTVRGRVDFRAINLTSKILSEGVASYEFKLVASEDGMKIRAESGKVVSRKRTRLH